MIRHFCDHCGLRVFEPERLMIRDGVCIDKYDLCDNCMKKVREWIFENDIKDENYTIGISDISDERIIFTDGSMLWYEHDADCCENNYADFKQLDDIGKVSRFVTPLEFEKTEHGFRFGNRGNMFFIPCYSEQSGYYSCDVDIIYNGVKVLTVEGELNDG